MWPARPAYHDDLLAQWQALGERLGIDAARQPVWRREGRRLLRSWALWPRRYHDTHHLHACLRHFAQVRGQLERPDTVELALWFHDAIYWPWSRHNEARSAAWAREFLARVRLPEALVHEVVGHVMATLHHAAPPAGDAQWVVDIDLAILGQDSAAYARFERDVRSEYRWVRWAKYRAGRSGVLRSFLDRPRVYGTPWFFERCEAAARRNLQAAIDALAQDRLYMGEAG